MNEFKIIVSQCDYSHVQIVTSNANFRAVNENMPFDSHQEAILANIAAIQLNSQFRAS